LFSIWVGSGPEAVAADPLDQLYARGRADVPGWGPTAVNLLTITYFACDTEVPGTESQPGV
jgi:hypothetical protein